MVLYNIQPNNQCACLYLRIILNPFYQREDHAPQCLYYN